MHQRRKESRKRRHRRIRVRVMGTVKIPRLCVFRSSKHIYAQLIDDEKARTLVGASDRELKSKVKSQKSNTGKPSAKKTALAYDVGRLIAEKALARKIQKVVFDRGGYKYHGRVKAVAEGAREGGLQF